MTKYHPSDLYRTGPSDNSAGFGRLRIDNDLPTVQDHNENTLHKIIIAIDFGTTYTGISYVHTSGAHLKHLEDVNVITSWPGPGREGDNAWKTPSRIAYAGENKMSQNAWGYGVTSKMKAYSWMKLRLDPEQATKYDDPTLKLSEGFGVLRLPPGKTAVDVCADYLKEIAVFAYGTLEQRISPEVLALSPLEFWFTVPAVWSDKAKFDTLKATEKAARIANLSPSAGCSTFLIPEPEAAAIAAVASITEGGSRQQIQPGDNILVCDCGGGTVDITTYTVSALEPSLEFKEYLVGAGGKCGSTYIDRQFLAWMSEKFGAAFINLPWERKGPASRFMKDFEGHKKDFGSVTNPNKEYEVTLSMKVADSKYYDTEEQVVKLYEEDFQRLFDPVIGKIVSLLEDQIAEDIKLSGSITIKTIILVGGFGDSRYLNSRLRQWCAQRDIRLVCPEHPQAAIVRGAALSGLQNLRPSSRRARRHYGICPNSHYDRRLHDRKYMYIDEFDGGERVKGYMNWMISKGDAVTEKTQLRIDLRQTIYGDIKKGSKNLKYTQQLYVCDDDNAPVRSDQYGTQKLAAISVDLNGFDLSQCPAKFLNGRLVTKIPFVLEVQIGSRRGVLCFRYLVNGNEAGSAIVSFDGEEGGPQSSGSDAFDGDGAHPEKDTSCCVM